MATKPTKVPVWNTGLTNNVEPSGGEKATGWAVDQVPPSSYFNWLQELTGEWLSYLKDGALTGDLSVYGDGGIGAAVTAYASTGNNSGVYGQSFGTGDGIWGVSASTGAGVKGSGGTTGLGVYGVGGSSGAGGSGVSGVGGGTAGYGVVGQGAGTGRGGSFTGGATAGAAGVYGTGGAGGGPGGNFAGTSTYAGVQAVGNSGPGLDGSATTGYGAKLTGNATRAALNLVPIAGDPSTPAEGDIWFNSSAAAGQKLRVYMGGAIHYVNNT